METKIGSLIKTNPHFFLRYLIYNNIAVWILRSDGAVGVGETMLECLDAAE